MVSTVFAAGVVVIPWVWCWCLIVSGWWVLFVDVDCVCAWWLGVVVWFGLLLIVLFYLVVSFDSFVYFTC